MDDTDEEESGTDDEADGMVLDERDGGNPDQEGSDYSDLSDDQASLRDSDGETDVDSVMMVSLCYFICASSGFYSVELVGLSVLIERVSNLT